MTTKRVGENTHKNTHTHTHTHIINRETDLAEGSGDGSNVWGNGVQPIWRVWRRESGECTDLPISETAPIANG